MHAGNNPPTGQHNGKGNERRGPVCQPSQPANTVTDRLNTALKNGGPGYILSLCPNEIYLIQAPILFSHPNQEISTAGYPTGDSRATLAVSGPVVNGQGHTNAVDGSCSDCSGVKLRNIQIDGRRGNSPPTSGGANIEMGGANANQLIEYVRSFNTRSWSCLHVSEGPLNCTNVTVQNNDIGPCGVDSFQEWADGISMSCRNSLVKNNMVVGATDGGIVLFGSPGTLVENNTIWILNNTLLGGINLVDYDPFSGDYTNTIVRNNTILGGFATDGELPGDTKGNNFENAVIKIGIAIGPRTWFGDKFGSSRNRNGAVLDNVLSGAFSYGIAVTSADNFTVLGNTLSKNTSFIGARGPNCSDSDQIPTPGPWLIDWATVGTDMNAGSGKIQTQFQGMSDGDSLTCVLPPNGGDFWPFGSNPSNGTLEMLGLTPTSGAGKSKNTAGVAVGVIVGIAAFGVLAFFGQKWLLRKQEEKRLYNAGRRMVQRSNYTNGHSY